jgi:short-subunit dehydrogenase
MKNKRIWLTGASRGIGLETAKLLAKKGLTLFLSASSPDSFKPVISQFKEFENIFFYPCDISDSNEVKNTYSKIQKLHQGVDILINNAGIGIFRSFLDTTEDDFDETIAVNLKGAFLCTKAVLPGMLKNKNNPMIINILSVATKKVFTGTVAYSTSKSALLTMSRVLREEVRTYGIKIIDIIPGATETDMWNAEIRQKYRVDMMQPVDIAKVIVNTIELNIEKRLITEEVLIRPIGGDL